MQVTDVSATPTPQKTSAPNAVESATRITVSPALGPVGTLVTVVVEGLSPVNALAPFASLSFGDSAGAIGEDSQSTNYTVDTRTLPDRSRLSLQYQIPPNVLVRASAGDQHPTRLTATSLGIGVIAFSDWRASGDGVFHRVALMVTLDEGSEGFDIGPGAPLAAFSELVPSCPVFRIREAPEQP